MKQGITFDLFCDAFWKLEREHQFTYKGKQALFEHLEAEEEATGVEQELDVIGLCCEYSEYPNAVECVIDYGLSMDDLKEMDDVEKMDDVEQTALAYLQDNTQVIILQGGGVIIRNY